jgi:hypothetical protein
MQAAQPRTRHVPRARHVAGIEMPRGLDGRSIGARKFKRLVLAYHAELGELGEADKALVAATAALAVHIERMQRDIVDGKDIDQDALVRLSSEHRRLLTTLRGRAGKLSGKDALAAHIAAKYGNRPDVTPEIDLEEDDEPEESDDAQQIEATVE